MALIGDLVMKHAMKKMPFRRQRQERGAGERSRFSVPPNFIRRERAAS